MTLADIFFYFVIFMGVSCLATFAYIFVFGGRERGARNDIVDHSLIHRYVGRTHDTIMFNGNEIQPFLAMAMAHYRFGPARSEVYHLMRDRWNIARSSTWVPFSHEEVYFLGQANTGFELYGVERRPVQQVAPSQA